MKLLRYNQEAIDIDMNDVIMIDAHDNFMSVQLKDGTLYNGYHLKR